MSRRSIDPQDTIVNDEKVNFSHLQKDLDDWKLPKISNQEKYKDRPSFSLIRQLRQLNKP